MTIDFMVKIIAFDCYLTKLRLLHVLKTRAATARVVSLAECRAGSREAAEPLLWSPGALQSPPQRQMDSKQKVHRASATFPKSPRLSQDASDRCEASHLQPSLTLAHTSLHMLVPAGSAVCGHGARSVVKALSGLKCLNCIITRG